jgi:hypothetical protein
MVEFSPLTNRYRQLRAVEALGGEDETTTQAIREMDRLYTVLIGKPVTSLCDALDKLAFAELCLLEESDPKEAGNLIREVTEALSAMAATGAPLPKPRLPKLKRAPQPPLLGAASPACPTGSG